MSQNRDLAPDFSPTGNQIVFVADYNRTIFVMNTSGTARRAIKIGKVARNPAFTPDGKHIYFLVETWSDGPVVDPQVSLWRIKTDGLDQKEIADTRLFSDPLNWRP